MENIDLILMLTRIHCSHPIHKYTIKSFFSVGGGGVECGGNPYDLLNNDIYTLVPTLFTLLRGVHAQIFEPLPPNFLHWPGAKC